MPPRSRAKDKRVAAEFGQRLRAARTEAGLSQEALAHAAGLHPTYISNAERGYSCPTIYTVIRLAKALAIDPGEMIAGMEP